MDKRALYPTRLPLFSFYLFIRCCLRIYRLHRLHRLLDQLLRPISYRVINKNGLSETLYFPAILAALFLQAFSPPGSSNFNTNNAAYPPSHITGVSRWTDFNITTIRSRYGNVLRNDRLPVDPVIPRPHPVVSETPIAHRVTQYITPRIVAALHCAFQYEQANHPSANRTPTTMDVGDMAHYSNGYIPDLAIYQDNWPNYQFGARPFNRCKATLSRAGSGVGVCSMAINSK